jgi:hypothetical protein
MRENFLEEMEKIVAGLCVEKKPGCASHCSGSYVANCHATKGKPIKY